MGRKKSSGARKGSKKKGSSAKQPPADAGPSLFGMIGSSAGVAVARSATIAKSRSAPLRLRRSRKVAPLPVAAPVKSQLARLCADDNDEKEELFLATGNKSDQRTVGDGSSSAASPLRLKSNEGSSICSNFCSTLLQI